MLSFETVDSWASASATVTVAGLSDTYTHAGSSSAYHVAIAFDAWLNDPARPWGGAAFFTWSWAKADNGGCALSFTINGAASATWTPNAFWSSLMQQSTQTAGTWAGSDGAAGTSAPARGVTSPGAAGASFWAVLRALQFSADEGDASAAQAVRPFVPGLAGSRPSVTAHGSVYDAARLTDVAARISNPRRFAVYQGHGERWIELAAGDVEVSALAPKIFKLSIAAAGDTL